MKRTSLPRYVVGGALILSFLAVQLSGGGGVQVHTSTVNSVSTYQASSSPILLVLSLVILTLYVWILRLPPGDGRAFFTAGLWRRFWAFMVDFMLSALITTPWIGFIALAMEAAHTGHFAWAVQREPALDGDWQISSILVLAGVVTEFIYFALPLYLRCATPGYVLLGIAMRYDSAKPSSLLGVLGRTLLASIALCCCVISVPMALSDPEKRMWQDQACGTRVVKWSD